MSELLQSRLDEANGRINEQEAQIAHLRNSLRVWKQTAKKYRAWTVYLAVTRLEQSMSSGYMTHWSP